VRDAVADPAVTGRQDNIGSQEDNLRRAEPRTHRRHSRSLKCPPPVVSVGIGSGWRSFPERLGSHGPTKLHDDERFGFNWMIHLAVVLPPSASLLTSICNCHSPNASLRSALGSKGQLVKVQKPSSAPSIRISKTRCADSSIPSETDKHGLPVMDRPSVLTKQP